MRWTTIASSHVEYPNSRELESDDHYIRGREVRLQVFARTTSDSDSKSTDTRILEMVRSADLKSVELLLPECNEVVSTGWVPEIVYKMKDTSDQLQIVIRPDQLFHSERRAGKDSLLDSDKSDILCSKQTGDVLHFNDNNAKTPEIYCPSSRKDDVLYRVTFENREIMVNRFRVCKPHFDSENDVVFEYLFKNPGRKIDLTEIETATKRTLNKKLYDIVRTLGFKNELKDIFFPHVSKTAIEFVNPVTEADFQKRKLREPQLVA